MNSGQNNKNEILQKFDYEGLPPHARIVGREFHDFAYWLANDLSACSSALSLLLKARNIALESVQHKDAPAE